MKKQVSSFLCGVFTTALIGLFIVSAFAASGQMTITVDPINIQVNGVIFEPKDVTGANVPVFAYNGTTYAPLRALAEAYGLEVGYDSENNMATVTSPGAVITPPSEEPSPAPTPVPSIKMYDKYTDVPDFGALFNISPSLTYAKDDTTMYQYSISQLDPSCITTYTDTVTQNGFWYIGSFGNGSGGEVLCYSNGVHSLSFGFMGMNLSVMVTDA